MHTEVASQTVLARLGALELNDARLEAAALAGPVQTHRFGCTMLETAARPGVGPTTGITCTPTLTATLCDMIDDGTLEAALPLQAGPTRGGCFMSNPPQCRPQPGQAEDGRLEASALRFGASPTQGCGFTEPPMCHHLGDAALEASASAQPQTQHCAPPPRTNIVMACIGRDDAALRR